MSVDREYSPRISNATDTSSARHVKDAVTDGTTDENIKIFENKSDAELHGVFRNLNEVLPGAGRLLRAALELNAPFRPGISSVSEKTGEKAPSEISSVSPKKQTKPLEESAAADSHPFLQAQNDLNGAGSGSIEFGATNGPGMVARSSEPSIDLRAGAGLVNQVLQFQKSFQVQGVVMNQQDAADLLAAIRQLGEVFFQHAQNGVTKQEFEREKIALRRLIESKGK